MAYGQVLMEGMDSSEDRVSGAAPADADEVQPVRRPSPAMTDEQMRRYLAEVGARLETRGLVGLFE
jgi:hypothetical protein